MKTRLKDRLFAQSALAKRIVDWNTRRLTKRKAQKRQEVAAQYDHHLGVLIIVKNEAMGIREWIDHYAWQGAGQIYLIDNGSTDNTKELIADHLASGFVKYIYMPERWGQEDHYWNAIGHFGILSTCQWLLVADADEFWFVKDGSKLSDLLMTDRFAAKDVIYGNWVRFGSSGLTEQPASVRTGFTQRMPGLEPLTKWIVRSAAMQGRHNLTVHSVIGLDSGRTVSEQALLQVNHYQIQSRSYFEQIKMSRGDVYSARAEDARDWRYFDGIDAPCTEEDTLLADLTREHENQQNASPTSGG